jgi:hypothetical protein
MSLANLLTEPISVLPAIEELIPDRYGNRARTFGSSLDYQGRLESFGSSEETTDRDEQIAEFRLFLPPDAIVSGSDQVTDANGLVYEVIGPPRLHRTPRGPHHIECRLKRVTG